MTVDDNGMCLLDDEDMSYHANTVVGAVTPIKKTNADRIRAMSDEELAEVISNLSDCDTCYLYHRGCSINVSCKDAVLEWLKKESE